MQNFETAKRITKSTNEKFWIGVVDSIFELITWTYICKADLVKDAIFRMLKNKHQACFLIESLNYLGVKHLSAFYLHKLSTSFGQLFRGCSVLNCRWGPLLLGLPAVRQNLNINNMLAYLSQSEKRFVIEIVANSFKGISWKTEKFLRHLWNAISQMMISEESAWDVTDFRFKWRHFIHWSYDPHCSQ